MMADKLSCDAVVALVAANNRSAQADPVIVALVYGTGPGYSTGILRAAARLPGTRDPMQVLLEIGKP